MLFDIFRCVLIYLHLLLFGVAIALVFWADLRILNGEMENRDYAYIGKVTLRLFIGLWISGLTIIFVDTGFEPAILADNPKLIIKLTCVFVLSLNAIMLHKVCLSILIRKSIISLRQALTLSVCGTLSTSHWLLAAFVGSAGMLGQFPLKTLLGIYLVTLALILLIGILISPYMQKNLNRQRALHPLFRVDLNLGDI